MTSGYAQARARRRAAGNESPFEKLIRESEENAGMVERCAFCPGWVFEGRAVDAIAAGRRHREVEHPELVGWKRPRRPDSVKSTAGAKAQASRSPRGSANGKRPYRVLSDEKVAELHGRHCSGESMGAICRSVFDVLGFASPESCRQSLRLAFISRDLPFGPSARGGKVAA